jgi:hypothetical protein
VAQTSPAGDEVQLSADHVGDTVAQLERRVFARFGERGLTKAVRDLGQLIKFLQVKAGQSQVRLRRTLLITRATSITIIAATAFALIFSLRAAVIEGLERTADWVPLVESVINDLVFAGLAVLFLWALIPSGSVRRTSRQRRVSAMAWMPTSCTTTSTTARRC